VATETSSGELGTLSEGTPTPEFKIVLDFHSSARSYWNEDLFDEGVAVPWGAPTGVLTREVVKLVIGPDHGDHLLIAGVCAKTLGTTILAIHDLMALDPAMVVRRSDQPDTWKLITGSGLVLSMRPPRWEELASDQSTFDKGVIEFDTPLPQRVKVETSSCQWYTPQWTPGTAPGADQEATWDPTTTNRLTEANLSADAHFNHLSARQWLSSDMSLRVVTRYRRSTTPPRPATRPTCTQLVHSPGREPRDWDSVLRNGNQGHRARSPSESEAKHPASRRGSHMTLDTQETSGGTPVVQPPVLISCASVSCDACTRGKENVASDHHYPGNRAQERDAFLRHQEPTDDASDTDSLSSSSLSEGDSEAQSPAPPSHHQAGNRACDQPTGPGYNGIIRYEQVGTSGIAWQDHRVLINQMEFVWSPVFDTTGCEDHLHPSSRDQIALKHANHAPTDPGFAVGTDRAMTQGIARVQADWHNCMRRCMTTDPANCLPALTVAWRATGAGMAHRHTASSTWVDTYVIQPDYLNTNPEAPPYCNGSLHYRVSRPWGLPNGAAGQVLRLNFPRAVVLADYAKMSA